MPEYHWYKLTFYSDAKRLGDCYVRAQSVDEAVALRPTHIPGWRDARLEVTDVG